MVKAMTKAIALANFKRDVYPVAVAVYGLRDKTAMRTEWGMYVDGLCRDDEVTDKQRMTWLNPF